MSRLTILSSLSEDEVKERYEKSPSIESSPNLRTHSPNLSTHETKAVMDSDRVSEGSNSSIVKSVPSSLEIDSPGSILKRSPTPKYARRVDKVPVIPKQDLKPTQNLNCERSPVFANHHVPSAPPDPGDSNYQDLKERNEMAKRKKLEANQTDKYDLKDIEVCEPLHTKETVDPVNAGSLNCNDKSAEDDDDPDLTVESHGDEDDDYQKPAKLDLIVGFLRLLNFVSCCTSIFAVAVSLLFPLSQNKFIIQDIYQKIYFENEFDEEMLNRQKRSDVHVLNPSFEERDMFFFLRGFAGIVQLVLLLVTAVFVIIDSVGTVTFRWKEYGELTHRHTDATSIMFLISKSRWKMRLLMCLTVASGVSLQTTQIILNFYGRSLEKASADTGHPASYLLLPDEIPEHALHAVIWYLSLMMAGILSFIIGYILHLIPAGWRDVPWLDNCLTEAHLDDKGDTWKSSYDLSRMSPVAAVGNNIMNLMKSTIEDQHMKLKCEEEEDETFYDYAYKQMTFFGHIIEGMKKVVYFISYVIAITMNLSAVLRVELSIYSFEFWTCIISTSCTTLMSLYLVILISIGMFHCPNRNTPFLSKVYVPFVLSSGLRLVLDLRDPHREVFCYMYMSLIILYSILHTISLFTKSCSVRRPIDFFLWKFLTFNFYKSEGAYKKCVRLFDTLGNFFGLLGLLFGLFSLFMDQYDLEFEPEGELKVISEKMEDFTDKVSDVYDTVKKIYSKFEFNITCENIYTMIGSGIAVNAILGIIPGGGHIGQLGGRSAYYTLQGGKALSQLALKLKSSYKTIWKLASVIWKAGKFATGNFKKFTIGGSAQTLLRLLPFFPPVVVGVHILFSAFWPHRILFFTASQRRRFIDGQFSHWFLILVLLILALCINTALVDELQSTFNEALPFLTVHVNKKFGWKLSLAASACAIVGSFSFIIAYQILKTKTEKDHENITNAEIEWRKMLEDKKKVEYYNPFGPKVEWKNQIKYKKERIGPWNWVLPIILCLVACGFGVVANLYPKIDMLRETKGSFGRNIEELYKKISVYELDMNYTIDTGRQECLPVTSFADVLRENRDDGRANILMSPIYKFFNKTEELVKPLRQIVSRMRKQFIADIGDDLFGQDVVEQIKRFRGMDLQYIGMLLLIPRAISLLILIFGMITMSIATCQMEIIPSIEPKKIVDAFGMLCIFSVIFVLGTQLAVFNVLSDFGIPFWRITIRLGLGFMYDVVCDSIMVSIWIGMKNEFFFAIPRRKVTVTYSVPGVSDSGPNIQNKIL